MLGSGSGLLIGVDLKKPAESFTPPTTTRAASPPRSTSTCWRGSTASWTPISTSARFAHEAFYAEREGRVEIYIRSLAAQRVRVAGVEFGFAAGERIHTEYSYKYDLDEFQRLAGRVGFSPARVWTDSGRLFSVHFLRVS